MQLDFEKECFFYHFDYVLILVPDARYLIQAGHFSPVQTGSTCAQKSRKPTATTYKQIFRHTNNVHRIKYTTLLTMHHVICLTIIIQLVKQQIFPQIRDKHCTVRAGNIN